MLGSTERIMRFSRPLQNVSIIICKVEINRQVRGNHVQLVVTKLICRCLNFPHISNIVFALFVRTIKYIAKLFSSCKAYVYEWHNKIKHFIWKNLHTLHKLAVILYENIWFANFPIPFKNAYVNLEKGHFTRLWACAGYTKCMLAMNLRKTISKHPWKKVFENNSHYLEFYCPRPFTNVLNTLEWYTFQHLSYQKLIPKRFTWSTDVE